MENIHIDPSQGEHAGAAHPDEMLQSLLRTLLFELAVRTDRKGFDAYLRGALSVRAEAERTVERVRYQRDLMQFAAEVRRDLEAIPVAES